MAKVLTVSLPDDLYEVLKKHREISPSALFQEAVRNEIARLTVEKMDHSQKHKKLAAFGANRLRKQMENKWEALLSRSHEYGQDWAAKAASLEELVWVFEEGDFEEVEIPEEVSNRAESGETWLLYSGTFGDETSDFLNSEILDKDEDNELFWVFVDGAKDMWQEMKKILESEK